MAKRGNIFTTVETNKPRSNVFNLSHDRKFSTKFGNLTPIMVMDCVPGDSVRIKPNAMVRFAPMLAPVMHRANVFMHYFFVPNRIMWDGFEDFITGGEDGMDNTVWAHGLYNPNNFEAGSLPDYLGLPINTDVVSNAGISKRISTLPFAAYQKIFNDYYRDQNLVNEVIDTVPSGEMPLIDFFEIQQIRKRAWQHDYFTSCLPWTQKGPEALLPLGDTAPVKAWQSLTGFENVQLIRDLSNNLQPNAELTSGANSRLQDGSGLPSDDIYLDLQDSHYADLSQATASSINDLRRAMQLQVWLERNARGGSRYTESNKMHFGVTSSDKRLQRAEYIGGMKTPVKISEVLQTSNNDTQQTPQGTMAGHGISVGGGNNFSYFCEEHGYIIGIMSIMPVSAYQQGFPRHFSRQDKFDYFWPEFAHIGEQPVMNSELLWSGDGTYNNGVFGYLPRYSEYKYLSNTVHGDFKTTLDFWQMGRKFSSLAYLNEDFINMDASEVDRIFAVQDGTDSLWCQVLNEVHAKRKMPVFGTPKIM